MYQAQYHLSIAAPNLLFICSKNQWRSPTAERIYQKDARCQVRSAGTSSKARRRVNANDLAWADFVLVMEKRHRSVLRERFPEEMEDVEVQILDIPDEYTFMDAELVALIQGHIESLLD